MSQFPPIINTVFFLSLFAGLWCAGFMVHAKLTGWSKLAKYYRAKGAPEGKTFRFRTMLLRFRLSYEMATHFCVNPEGIHIAIFFIFRPGHPALFIPWSEITVSRSRIWFIHHVCLETKQVPGLKIRIYEKLGNKLLNNTKT